MARVFFESDTPVTYDDLNLTAQEIISKHAPAEKLQDYELFLKNRKIGRDQKLSDVVKGDSNVFRILSRITSRTPPPANLREEVVQLDEKIKKFGMYEDRRMIQHLYDNDICRSMIEKYPIILEEPILLNVLTDYSLMSAMLHEEHGFVQQHPSFVTILEKILVDALPGMGLMNTIQNTFNFDRRARGGGNAAAGAGPSRTPFTAQMLQNALSHSLAGLNPSHPQAAVNGVPPPFVPPSLTPPTVPPFEGPEEPMPAVESLAALNRAAHYTNELEQLHNLGFLNDEENIMILDSCDGNVETAINLLFAMRD